MACTGDVSVIAPCTPAPGSDLDPCARNAPPIEMPGGGGYPYLGDEPATMRDLLDDDDLPPTCVSLLVVRSTYLPNTVSCTAGDTARPYPHSSQD